MSVRTCVPKREGPDPAHQPGKSDRGSCSLISKLGRTHAGDLLVKVQSQWYQVKPDGNVKSYTAPESTRKKLSEWQGDAFVQHKCSATYERGRVIITGAKNVQINGVYKKMLGGYKSKNGLWFMRSSAGQEVVVCTYKKGTKVLAVQETLDPMVVDVSITSSEIKSLYKEIHWKKCKYIVWKLREKESRNHSAWDPPKMFAVQVSEIENSNKGRKNASFV